MDRLISKKELRTIVLYSPSHIDRMEKAGTFPKRVRLGQNRVAWWKSDIQKWLDALRERASADTP